MRVLDIDLDFFVEPINNVGTRGRPSEEFYTVWSLDRVKHFLETQCLLSAREPRKGWVFRHHDEAFYYWSDLISEGALEEPFDLVHVDAHSDMGTEGFHGWHYVMTELLALPIHERHMPDARKIGPSNFPVFALANRWIRHFTFVMPASYENDMCYWYWADPNDAYHGLQLKLYDESGIKHLLDRDDRAVPLSVEPIVPLELVRAADYQAAIPFDIVTLCQSPHYSPASADPIIELFRKYIRT